MDQNLAILLAGFADGPYFSAFFLCVPISSVAVAIIPARKERAGSWQATMARGSWHQRPPLAGRRRVVQRDCYLLHGAGSLRRSFRRSTDMLGSRREPALDTAQPDGPRSRGSGSRRCRDRDCERMGRCWRASLHPATARPSRGGTDPAPHTHAMHAASDVRFGGLSREILQQRGWGGSNRG